jgi:hypothetical protein
MWPDLTAMLNVVEHARVVDFMRFVSGERRERPEIDTLAFRDGWNLMIGAYASKYADPYPVTNGGDEK